MYDTAIKNLMSQRGVTFTRLAADTGLSKNTLSRIINGRSKEISILTLQRISRSLGMRTSELVRYTEDQLNLPLEVSADENRDSY